MADRVHPAMKEVQPPAADATRDRRGRQPECEELRSSDHAVLAARQRRDSLVRDEFVSHSDT